MPGYGQLYWVSLPFILLGIVGIIKKRSFIGFLILYLLLISPIPAALTKESPHALRSIAALPFYAIIVGVGLEYLTNRMKKYSSGIIVVASLLFLLSFESYLTKYFTDYPVISSKDWQYGYQEIYKRYGGEFSNYSGVFISDEYAQPYIFTLFYQKIDPQFFRDTSVLSTVDNWGQSKILRIGREYEYKFTYDKTIKNLLVFTTEKDKIKDVKPADEIKFLNGDTAFWVYKL